MNFVIFDGQGPRRWQSNQLVLSAI